MSDQKTDKKTTLTGLKRGNTEKYYTKPEVVKKCIELFKKHVEINDVDLFVEPSAGNGAFINEIKTLGKNYVFLDVEPEHKEIFKQDFLEWNFDFGSFGGVHVIGNPPFGKLSSIAKQFIKKSCKFADTIAFILPRSFKKETMQKCFDSKFHLVCENDLGINSFHISGLEYDVPCVYQIWVKYHNDRKLEEKHKPIGFEFVKKTENPDVAFRRVGGNAGTVSKDCASASVQSNYFIKFDKNINVDSVLPLLNSIKYTFNNTVAAKSINKNELTKEFNKILNVNDNKDNKDIK
jgi:hypothetical protein